MYTYWSDLGIVILKIVSEKKLVSDMMKFSEDKPNRITRIVKIMVYDIENYDDFPYQAETYRENIMEKGFYIGHHFGKKTRLKIIKKNEIHICTSDINRILWSYVTKWILTIYCIQEGYLHIKAGAVEYKGKVIILVGRGGAGKTEMIKALCLEGAKYITNTHAIVKKNRLLGIQTNIRVRENGEEYFVSPEKWLGKQGIDNGWKKIDYIFWIQHRTDECGVIKKMSSKEIFLNMKYFSEAIVNWGLYEDIYDFYHSDIFKIGKEIQRIDKKLLFLTKSTKNYYVNVDIMSEIGRKKLKKII